MKRKGWKEYKYENEKIETNILAQNKNGRFVEGATSISRGHHSLMKLMILNLD